MKPFKIQTDTHFVFKEICETHPKEIIWVKYRDEDFLFIPKSFLNKFECADEIRILKTLLYPQWGSDGWGVATKGYNDSCNPIGNAYHSYSDIHLTHHRGTHLHLFVNVGDLCSDIEKAIEYLRTKRVLYECVRTLPDDVL